jgi:hypothetical protein
LISILNLLYVDSLGTRTFASILCSDPFQPHISHVNLLGIINLDAMVVQLRAANIDVSPDPEKYPNGRFARLHDPKGQSNYGSRNENDGKA